MGTDQQLVLSAVGSLVGLDPATGNVLWRLDGITGNSTPTPTPLGDGRFLIGATVGRGESDSGRAAESNGCVKIQKDGDGKFHAEYIWRANRATSSFGSPIVHQGLAYFVNATGVLFCHAAETGEEIYTARIGDSIWATPIALRDRICFFGKSGTTSIVAAGPQFERVGEYTAWRTEQTASADAARPAGGPVLYAAVVAGDRLLLRRGDAIFCIGTQQ